MPLFDRRRMSEVKSPFQGFRKGEGRFLKTGPRGGRDPWGLFYDESKHYVRKVSTMHKHPEFFAYGFESRIVEELERLGCRTVELEVSDSGDFFFTTFDTFLKRARYVPGQGTAGRGLYYLSCGWVFSELGLIVLLDEWAGKIEGGGVA